jgi:hypothetical protein
MSSQIVMIAASLIALLGSILTLLVGTRLALRKERRQLLWSKEIDRFLALEELAGQLVEELSSYRPIPQDQLTLATQLEALHHAAGRFARYPAVRQAIRDLHNTLGRMVDAKSHREDDRAIGSELDPALRQLLVACDQAIERDRLRT